MKKHMLFATAAFALSVAPAFADNAPVSTTPATVTFSMKADQQTLTDPSQKDSYIVDLSDTKVSTTLKLACNAGSNGIIYGHTDESCSVSGVGYVLNGTKLRVQIAGGWVEKADGFTDVSTISANYLPVGNIPGSNSTFGGNMKLKPKVPSSETMVFKDAILKKIGASATSGAMIDQRVDTIQLSGVRIPSSGMPSDGGCTWTGNMGFFYQTNSWDMDIQAICNGKVYPLKGSMPWTETKGVPDQTEYNLTLSLPSAASTSDQSLTASPDDAGLSATADGISGKITMKQSNVVKVKVDGVLTDVPVNIDASGTFTGQNVPIEAVRSLGMLVGTLSRAFFGA